MSEVWQAEFELSVDLDTEVPGTKVTYEPGAQEQVWTRERFESCTLVRDIWSYGAHARLGEKEQRR